MQGTIKERESLEIVDQTQIPRYISRFESLLYVFAFTQKDFHYVHTGPPTKGTSTEEFAIIKLGVHNSSLSPTQPPLHKRQSTKPKQQSPLLKRDKGTKPKLNHNHLQTRGIATNLK